MKVLMATMKLDIGGAETHIVELSKALKRRGVDVWVASAGGAYESELREAGVNHIYVPMSGKKSLRRYDLIQYSEKTDQAGEFRRGPRPRQDPLLYTEHDQKIGQFQICHHRALGIQPEISL